MKWKVTYTLKVLNYGFFIAGMGLLWWHTHDWVVLVYATIASIHVTVGLKIPQEGA